MRAEGIGRLLAFIVEGAAAAGNFEVTLAAPKWSEKELHKLFEDHGIIIRDINFLLTDNIPYMVRLFWFVKRLKLKGRRKVKVRSLYAFVVKMREIVKLAALDASSSATIMEAVRNAMVLLLVLVPFIPLGLVILMLRYARRGVAWVTGGVLHGISARAHRYYGQIRRAIGDYTLSKERMRLVKKVNDVNSIDSWFIPTLFWPETVNIKKIKTVAAPDIVFLEYPADFAQQYAVHLKERMANVARSFDKIITYSEYVKENHLVKALGVERSRVNVIRHGRVDLAGYLIEKKADVSPTVKELREAGARIYRDFVRTNSRSIPEGALHLECKDFVIYTSHLRPYKNISTLIRALSEVNRARNEKVSLVITADVSGSREINDIIMHYDLNGRVIQLPRLPSKILASINSLAILSINPTLFEGGFPFTFAEAFSVGTPSVMSDIAVVREQIIDPDLARVMLFDPYDVSAMAERILWGLANHSELYERQRPVFAQMASWKEVSANYLQEISSSR